MSSAGIIIPESDWHEFYKNGFATITCELDNDFGMDDVIRVDVLNDIDFMRQFGNDSEEFIKKTEIENNSFKYFVPKYIRCTKVSGITQRERNALGGDEDLILYLQLGKLTKNDLVKIIVFEPLKYNLKELNSYF